MNLKAHDNSDGDYLLQLRNLLISLDLDHDLWHGYMRKLDLILILAVVSLFVYWILIIINPLILGPFHAAYDWFLDFSVLLGYPGAFIISLIGNATILLPFPYIGVPFILGGVQTVPSGPFIFDPWLIGLVSGIGATIGEMTGYAIGYAGGELIKEEQRSRIRDLALQHPKLTPFLLWFVAATPIPDDVLVVPLGASKYPWWKVLAPQLIGKTMFLTGIAWAGRLSLSWIGNLLIGDPTSLLSKSIEVVALLLVILAVYLMVRMDWTSYSRGNTDNLNN
jgi:membrane protein YqaA with SNARE-associated domain